MPTYLGEEVSQEFVDMILRVYKQAYEAAHPTHQAPTGDDATILAGLEDVITTGGPEADGLARYLANPPVVGDTSAQGRVWPKEGWPTPAA